MNFIAATNFGLELSGFNKNFSVTNEVFRSLSRFFRVGLRVFSKIQRNLSDFSVSGENFLIEPDCFILLGSFSETAQILLGRVGIFVFSVGFFGVWANILDSGEIFFRISSHLPGTDERFVLGRPCIFNQVRLFGNWSDFSTAGENSLVEPDCFSLQRGLVRNFCISSELFRSLTRYSRFR